MSLALGSGRGILIGLVLCTPCTLAAVQPPVTCNTRIVVFRPAGGCNGDSNGDHVLEHYDACECQRHVKTCSNGYIDRWLTCTLGIPRTPVSNSTITIRNPSPPLFPPIPLTCNSVAADSEEVLLDSRDESARVRLSSPSSTLEKRLNLLRYLHCKDGFATLYDASGKPIESVSPCSGEWVVPLSPGEPRLIPR